MEGEDIDNNEMEIPTMAKILESRGRVKVTKVENEGPLEHGKLVDPRMEGIAIMYDVNEAYNVDEYNQNNGLPPNLDPRNHDIEATKGCKLLEDEDESPSDVESFESELED